MKTVNKIQALIIALLCSGFTNDGTWIIDSESTLSIHGATNFNKFVCAIQSYPGHDTLQYFNNHTSSELQFASNQMLIPIEKFDCGSRQISEDFRSTLKSDAYPYLKIRLIALSGDAIKANQLVDGRMDISLAGVTKRYTVKFKTGHENGDIVLSGFHPVNFSDFNLIAPEKLKGIIRVKNNLNVEFHLVLKSV